MFENIKLWTEWLNSTNQGEEKMSEEKTMSFKAKMEDGREVECPAPDPKEWRDTGEGDKKIPEKQQKNLQLAILPNKVVSVHVHDDKGTSNEKGKVTHEMGKCYLDDMGRHLNLKAKLTSYTIWEKKK